MGSSPFENFEDFMHNSMVVDDLWGGVSHKRGLQLKDSIIFLINTSCLQRSLYSIQSGTLKCKLQSMRTIAMISM